MFRFCTMKSASLLSLAHPHILAWFHMEPKIIWSVCQTLLHPFLPMHFNPLPISSRFKDGRENLKDRNSHKLPESRCPERGGRTEWVLPVRKSCSGNWSAEIALLEHVPTSWPCSTWYKPTGQCMPCPYTGHAHHISCHVPSQQWGNMGGVLKCV